MQINAKQEKNLYIRDIVQLLNSFKEIQNKKTVISIFVLITVFITEENLYKIYFFDYNISQFRW